MCLLPESVSNFDSDSNEVLEVNSHTLGLHSNWAIGSFVMLDALRCGNDPRLFL